MKIEGNGPTVSETRLASGKALFPQQGDAVDGAGAGAAASDDEVSSKERYVAAAERTAATVRAQRVSPGKSPLSGPGRWGRGLLRRPGAGSEGWLLDPETRKYFEGFLTVLEGAAEYRRLRDESPQAVRRALSAHFRGVPDAHLVVRQLLPAAVRGISPGGLQGEDVEKALLIAVPLLSPEEVGALVGAVSRATTDAIIASMGSSAAALESFEGVFHALRAAATGRELQQAQMQARGWSAPALGLPAAQMHRLIDMASGISVEQPASLASIPGIASMAGPGAAGLMPSLQGAIVTGLVRHLFAPFEERGAADKVPDPDVEEGLGTASSSERPAPREGAHAAAEELAEHGPARFLPEARNNIPYVLTASLGAAPRPAGEFLPELFARFSGNIAAVLRDGRFAAAMELPPGSELEMVVIRRRDRWSIDQLHVRRATLGDVVLRTSRSAALVDGMGALDGRWQVRGTGDGIEVVPAADGPFSREVFGGKRIQTLVPLPTRDKKKEGGGGAGGSSTPGGSPPRTPPAPASSGPLLSGMVVVSEGTDAAEASSPAASAAAGPMLALSPPISWASAFVVWGPIISSGTAVYPSAVMR